MKQAKHTPGPWETDCKDHDAPYQNIKVNSGYRNICAVWIDDAPVHDYNAEQEANARLIAAAPDLLEACEQALWNSLDLPEHVRIILQSAITKATGA